MKLLYLLVMCFLPFFRCFPQESGLPLQTSRSDSSGLLVVHISGDGGWRGFDVKMADQYSSHGLSYVALNSFKYFWSAKTPAQLADDMAPVIRLYMSSWHKDRLVLVGFSFGAEVIPFFYNRLPADLREKIIRIIMITPAASSDFTIHLSDMIGADHQYAYDVVKEVEQIRKPGVLILFGEEEHSTFPENHKQDNVVIEFVKGSHHFTDATTVMTLIKQKLNAE